MSIYFTLYLLVGFGSCFWLACFISIKHLLALIFLSISIIEYVKETIGIVSGMWVHHGVHGSYNFGVWCWVLGRLSTYTLSTRIIIRRIRKFNLPVTPRGNTQIIFALFLLIPITLMDYWKRAGGCFWSFYILVLFTCLNLATRGDFPVLAGIVVISWIVGTSGEYIGSVTSHIWTFPLIIIPIFHLSIW